MSEKGRNDISPAHEAVGKDRYDVWCLDCRGHRGSWSASRLPEPGVCARCKALDPRTYWTRDWPGSEKSKGTEP